MAVPCSGSGRDGENGGTAAGACSYTPALSWHPLELQGAVWAGGSGRGRPAWPWGPPGPMGDSMPTIEERVTQRGGGRARSRGLGVRRRHHHATRRRHAPVPELPVSAGLPVAPGHKSLHSRRAERVHQVKTIVGVQSGQRCGRASGGKRERERHTKSGSTLQAIRGTRQRGVGQKAFPRRRAIHFKSKVRGAGQWVRHTRPSCSSGRQHNSRGRGKTLCPAGGAQDYWG